MSRNHLLRMAVCPCILLAAKTAFGADTVESWDKGAADFEVYAGAEGLGKKLDDVTVFSDSVIGFGLEERFSGYFGATLEGQGDLDPNGAALYMGFFGTPVETDHFDVDLFLDFSGLDGFSVSPGVELNWDREPQMSSFGLYGRAFVPVYAEETSNGSQDAPTHSAVRFDLLTTLGGYVTLAERHQLLLEVGLDFVDFPSEGGGLGTGAAALGYNVAITDNLEIIAEVSAAFHGEDAPQKSGFPRCWTKQRTRCGLGASIGFIATLPR